MRYRQVSREWAIKCYHHVTATLEDRRKAADKILMYKVENSLVAVPVICPKDHHGMLVVSGLSHTTVD